MLFIYKAVDQKGNQKEGTITAISKEVAISSLQRRGFVISDIKESDGKGDSLLNMNITFLERVSMKDIVILSQQLSTLFSAQVSALRVFRLLGSESENPKLGRALNDIAENLQAGSSISASLEKHSDIFDSFYVSMVKAGEESGRLDESFSYLAEHLDRTFEVTSKAKNALIYPAFIIFTFFSVMGLMLTMVIPKIAGILTDSGQEIPSYTKFVIGLSNFLVNYGWVVIVGLVVLIFLGLRLKKTPAGKRTLDELKLSIPIVGNLFEKLYLSRVADNLDTMLASGIPMVKALELTIDVVDSEVYGDAIRESLRDVEGGSSLSDSFAKHEEFPNILIQLIRVGEETGNLGEILGTLAKFYRREVTNAVDTLVGMIEPIMIVALSVGVGFLLASVLIPIYNISSGF
jgi:type IV pilus assembly protein PilC